MKESKIEIDVKEYEDRFNTGMLNIVHDWCNGAKFRDIADGSIYEGSIIRCIRRLEELLRQLASAAKVVGDTMLEKKFQEARELMVRDIVFAPSLYL